MNERPRTFSEERGIVQKKLQIECMDPKLKNMIWSALSESFRFFNHSIYREDWRDGPDQKLAFSLCVHHLGARRDQLTTQNAAYTVLDSFFKKAAWNEIYDLVQFIVQNYKGYSNVKIRLINDLNKALVYGDSGYRIVEDRVVQMVSDEEINAIAESVHKGKNAWDRYILEALDDLSNRTNDNYEITVDNAIKAAETAMAMVVDRTSGTLTQLAGMIDEDILDGHIAAAYKDFYSYSNKVARHINTEKERKISMGTAKLVLMNCVSLCNYLSDFIPTK